MNGEDEGGEVVESAIKGVRGGVNSRFVSMLGTQGCRGHVDQLGIGGSS